MAIRIRIVKNKVIALCTAETDEKENDIYLDDNIHHALTTKFSNDWKLGFEDSELLNLMQEEKVRTSEQVEEEWLKIQSKDE